MKLRIQACFKEHWTVGEPRRCVNRKRPEPKKIVWLFINQIFIVQNISKPFPVNIRTLYGTRVILNAWITANGFWSSSEQVLSKKPEVIKEATLTRPLLVIQWTFCNVRVCHSLWPDIKVFQKAFFLTLSNRSQTVWLIPMWVETREIQEQNSKGDDKDMILERSQEASSWIMHCYYALQSLTCWSHAAIPERLSCLLQERHNDTISFKAKGPNHDDMMKTENRRLLSSVWESTPSLGIEKEGPEWL